MIEFGRYKPDLFVVTGASGAGKSAAYRQLLYRHCKDYKYLAFESDILWTQETVCAFGEEETGNRPLWEMCLKTGMYLCQGGIPFVLCGCVLPAQLEACTYRAGFAALHTLALFCDEEELLRRLAGRGVDSEDWFASAASANADFGRAVAAGKLRGLNTTGRSREDVGEIVDRWIRGGIPGGEG